MVKKLLLIMMTGLLLSCVSRTEDTNSQEKRSFIKHYTVRDDETCVSGTFYVIEVDGCEYVAGTNSLAHKGNCKFCEERRKNGNSINNDKEKEETWTW